MKQLIQIQSDSKNQIIPQRIDLSDSFILSWKKDDSDFEIELELSIWPESPYYSKPLKDEFTCYKRGRLRFFGVKKINGFVDLETVHPHIDPDGSNDWGCIYDFEKDNTQFKFSTDFTEIEIECTGFELELNE